jgi:hypothetical protein
MGKLWGLLDGKKTYLAVGVFLGLVVLEKFVGIDIPKFDVGPNWLEEVLLALGIGGLRAAKPVVAVK